MLHLVEMGGPMVWAIFATAALALGAALHGLLARVDHTGPGLALLLRLGLIALVAVLGGATMMRNRVWADPVTLWTNAAERAPGVWAPHYALGNAYSHKRRCDLAVDAYRQAIKLLPDEPRAHLNLGICLAFLRDDEGAKRVFKSVLALSPGNIKAQNNLGQLAMREKAWQEAEQHFKGVLQRDPRNVKAMAGLGVAAKIQNDTDAAVRYLESTLQLDPTNTFAMLHLAHTYETLLSNPDRALRYYMQVMALDPKTPGAAEGAHRCREALRRQR